MLKLIAVALLAAIAAPTVGWARPEQRQALIVQAHPGDDLRARLDRALPESSEMVIAYGVAAHHSKVEVSVVAWRTASGDWLVERTGEEISYAPPPPGSSRQQPRAIPPTVRTLPVEAATRLHALLTNRGLYRQASGPPRAPEAPPIGAPEWEMELSTPVGRRTVRWSGRLEGKAGEVADIVLSAVERDHG